MYPKKQKKTDRERFLQAFIKTVGAEPQVYVKRKLAAGTDEKELQRLYDQVAIDIAMRAHCTAIRYAELFAPPAPPRRSSPRTGARNPGEKRNAKL